ncbi:MAG: hypothetical protein SF053_05355 [Bacteroidia bacterium]|nr:hypothetical protein [Bacteroidia bacterium]
MSASPHIPVVFMACVNSYLQDSRLRYIVQERKAISQILQADPERVFFQPVQKGNVPHSRFLELLEQGHYHERINILHFCGHADTDHLRIESESLETVVPMSELSKWIGRLPKLQAVFLSGCATPRLLEMLLRWDIPAILVTQTFEKNMRAIELAKTFYYYLAQGCTLVEAYRFTSTRFEEFMAVEVGYDMDTDQLAWDGKDSAVLPWGLYYFAHNFDKLSHRQQRRPLLPFPNNDSDSKDVRTRRRRKLLRYVAFTLILGLIAAGLTFLLDGQQQFSQLIRF